MNIEYVDLENIGCHRHRKIDFSDLTVVYGENRTGKSTLVYALFFALFGSHLHKSLKTADLCRIGEQFGTASVGFREGKTHGKLSRPTTGIPLLQVRTEADPAWNVVSADDPVEFRKYIPWSADIASLTSFFREGELIYFLQDIPKYDKTLLQNMIEMDDVLIVRSRFNKCLKMAREEKKALHKAQPNHPVSSITLSDQQKLIADLEKELEAVNAEHRNLSEYQDKPVDPAVFRLLKQQVEENRKALDTAAAKRQKLPPVQELETRRIELEQQPADTETITARKDELQRRYGNQEHKRSEVKTRIEQLGRLGKQPDCYACGQPVSRDRLATLTAKLNEELKGIDHGIRTLEQEISNVRVQEQHIKAQKKELDVVDRQLVEARRLEEMARTLELQGRKAEDELNRYTALNQMSEDAQKRIRRLQELGNQKAGLEKRLIDQKAALKLQETALKQREQTKAELKQAERNVVVCKTALDAIEYAVQSVSRGLMEGVRDSIHEWASRFTFLQQFDIEITARQLSPIIQARGYQYKLNQMSKSERIFLYLMLKLSMGDALSHLGAFILDDPADGLDLKRKQMMARLLTEISRKRQIIVTTNDTVFADQFPAGARVEL